MTVLLVALGTYLVTSYGLGYAIMRASGTKGRAWWRLARSPLVPLLVVGGFAKDAVRGTFKKVEP